MDLYNKRIGPILRRFVTTSGVSDITVNDTLWINGIGPLSIDTMTSTSFIVPTVLFEEGGNVNTKWRVFKSATNSDVKANSILIIDGRRYKVASVLSDGSANSNGTANNDTKVC
jgi:hypothetical protein